MPVMEGDTMCVVEGGGREVPHTPHVTCTFLLGQGGNHKLGMCLCAFLWGEGYSVVVTALAAN